METSRGVQAARDNQQSVLTTIRSDGRPQLSNVVHAVGVDGLIRISTTAARAKTANLRRTPWAALHVNGPDFWSYAVLECDVGLSPVAGDPGDPVVEELIALYRAISGEHDDWEAFSTSMVGEGRLVVRLTPTRAYGALR